MAQPSKPEECEPATCVAAATRRACKPPPKKHDKASCGVRSVCTARSAVTAAMDHGARGEGRHDEAGSMVAVRQEETTRIPVCFSSCAAQPAT
ncbi:hypothetical protein HPB50_015926 [Hyalomma asiaticum]|uniref:Uncharacterized protein n=1 Tax=Hyalomma asiaticum TaxID=266040 RepID=A0ACB7RU61_HYAAI|nr:hypothetical protein HPB50_015926 [Hyalomma asiaticum]